MVEVNDSASIVSNKPENISGMIFDIKRFATGDGPGIRGLIFLKGCSLRCKWCANPESQVKRPQIMYYQEKCTGCGKCIASCSRQAIKENERWGLYTDRKKCTNCGKCVEVCLYEARELIGEEKTAVEVMELIRRDRKFYENSGGGITLSGGEPLYQCEFARQLLRMASQDGIHTAIETTGFTSWSCLQSVVQYLDLIFYDFKHIDFEKHKKYTGVSNEKIIDNLKKLNSYLNENKVIIRIPFIPGYNSSDKIQRKMYSFISQLSHVKRVEIMPYHRLGSSKHFGLNRYYELKKLEPVKKDDLVYLIELGKECGVKVRIDSK